ncbi:hypothetical protein P4O66_013937 [Electrophorus voltai]|uniref:Reverse transcriptase domain-containing protein n=1 Tax=Electrophorus voltai TaxID=2609070 RepID=A0AAD8Z602_9TELE|nr:hypothetical protein P4O66_013937 [Electrophorus voltai]
MVVGLISNDDDSAYKEEVNQLLVWCDNNNLSLNVNKTKEIIVDFRRKYMVCSCGQASGPVGPASADHPDLPDLLLLNTVTAPPDSPDPPPLNTAAVPPDPPVPVPGVEEVTSQVPVPCARPVPVVAPENSPVPQKAATAISSVSYVFKDLPLDSQASCSLPVPPWHVSPVSHMPPVSPWLPVLGFVHVPVYTSIPVFCYHHEICYPALWHECSITCSSTRTHACANQLLDVLDAQAEAIAQVMHIDMKDMATTCCTR